MCNYELFTMEEGEWVWWVAFISRKIQKVWKNKSGSRWKNFSKKVFNEKKDREKSFVVRYESKKPKHFKSEWQN